MKKLKDNFENKIKKDLMKDLKLDNPYEVPYIEKISINMGVGSNKENKDFIEEAKEDLANITGQKPKEVYSKKAISGFKLREGDLIGLNVTLRKELAWDFLEKLIKVVLPRVRDFRGVKTTSFDGQGNYSLGISEHFVFPEINPDEVKHLKSLQINISTTSQDDEKARKFLKSLGMPFRK